MSFAIQSLLGIILHMVISSTRDAQASAVCRQLWAFYSRPCEAEERFKIIFCCLKDEKVCSCSTLDILSVYRRICTRLLEGIGASAVNFPLNEREGSWQTSALCQYKQYTEKLFFKSSADKEFRKEKDTLQLNSFTECKKATHCMLLFTCKRNKASQVEENIWFLTLRTIVLCAMYSLLTHLWDHSAKSFCLASRNIIQD